MTTLAGLDGWQLLAGLGLFLLGMDQLERAIHALAGASFNGLLRRVTGHPLLSVLFGVVATGILQSSSILGLMVLAFVGAGVLPMRNALGVILGSNIGSTFTGWIVAAVGFRLDIEALALPLVGAGALLLLFTAAETRRNAVGATGLALGLLLLGIGYMTQAAQGFAGTLDPALLAGHHPLVFFLAGVVITVIVRTSAATILMALSAMNAGILGLEQAAAIAIGADLGTTSTMLIAAVRGVAAKKQVALFHLLFNAVTDVLALLFLLPHVVTITAWYGIEDPLLALPAFHSTFNILGALLFYPLTGRIGDWLATRFAGGGPPATVYIGRVPPTATDAAVTALDNEVRALCRQALALHRDALQFGGAEAGADFPRRYDTLKQREGAILAYVRQMQSRAFDDTQARRLAALLVAAREAVQCAKGVKDIRGELRDIRLQANPWLAAWIDDWDAVHAGFHDTVQALLAGAPDAPLEEGVTATLAGCDARVTAEYAALRQRLHAGLYAHGLDDLGLSTLLNILHEAHGSARALLRGCRAVLLNDSAA